MKTSLALALSLSLAALLVGCLPGTATVPPTLSPTVTQTSEPTPTPMPTALPTATATPQPTASPLATPTAALQPTATSAEPPHTAYVPIIKIGVINPLTGNLSSVGVPATRGVEMAALDLNGAGGIVLGGIRYVFQMLEGDDQGMTRTGITAWGQVTNEGASFFVGATTSAVVVIETPWMENGKVIDIVGAPPYPVFLNGQKYTFRFADGAMLPPPHQSLPVWQLLKSLNPGMASYFMAAPDNQTGWDTAQADMDAAGSLGMTVAGYSFYVPTMIDFRPLASEIKAKKPDIVDIRGCSVTSAAMLIKALRASGYEGNFVGVGWSGPDLIAAGCSNSDIEGVYVVEAATTGPKLPPKVEAFFKRYEAKYGVREAGATNTYDMLFMLAEGMKKADSLDPDKVADALESLAGRQFDLLWGPTTVGGLALYGRNAQILGPIPVSEIRDGQNVQIGVVLPVEVPPPMKKWW